MIRLYIFLMFIIFSCLKSFGQNESYIVDILVKEIPTTTNTDQIDYKIDSLKKYISKDIYVFDNDYGIVDIFEREIDFNYVHQRIEISNSVDDFQLDFVKKNNQILLFIIQLNTWESKKRKLITKYFVKDSSLINEYIKNRNSFYKTDKRLEDLISEISLNQTFAINFGYAFTLTQTAKEIQSLIDQKNYDEIFSFLKSYNIENQAFGTYGLSLMKKKKIKIPKEIKRIEKHIKKRNSDTLICAGCICGIVKKIF